MTVYQLIEILKQTNPYALVVPHTVDGWDFNVAFVKAKPDENGPAFEQCDIKEAQYVKIGVPVK